MASFFILVLRKHDTKDLEKDYDDDGKEINDVKTKNDEDVIF